MEREKRKKIHGLSKSGDSSNFLTINSTIVDRF